MTTPAPEEYLLIGEIVGPFGTHGQVKLKAITDQVEHLRRRIRTVYIGPQRQSYRLQRVVEHKPGMLVLNLVGLTTRDEAEALRGNEVAILEREAAPLDQDEYFVHQLYGLAVFSEAGEAIGTVREVMQTGANDVLVVAREGKPDGLIPVIRDVIVELDIPNNRVVIRLLEGLLP
ncbi:MAG TPA: ribosome maturation factor RimM [Roseiflexaceae bacterium]|nr:ribosome maturation factor RimM [Roseiflexaceae bacterium]